MFKIERNGFVLTTSLGKMFESKSEKLTYAFVLSSVEMPWNDRARRERTMKKLCALCVVLSFAACGLFGEEKSVKLVHTVQAWSEFGFSKDYKLTSFMADGDDASYELENSALWVGYKTNESAHVALWLKATTFNSEGGHENIGFTICSDNGTHVKAGGEAGIVAEDSVTGTKGVRTVSKRIHYTTWPDFSSFAAGDYKATLTLTYEAK